MYVATAIQVNSNYTIIVNVAIKSAAWLIEK